MGTSPSKYPSTMPDAKRGAVCAHHMQLTASINHHVSDMVVAMLINLRPVFEQMAVLVHIVDQCLPVFILDGALPVLFDFIVHLSIKPNDQSSCSVGAGIA